MRVRGNVGKITILADIRDGIEGFARKISMFDEHGDEILQTKTNSDKANNPNFQNYNSRIEPGEVIIAVRGKKPNNYKGREGYWRPEFLVARC